MATPTTLPNTFVAGNVLTAAQMNNLRGAFRVLQVVNTIKSDTFVSGSISQGGTVDITGLSASITPSSTSSKILVSFQVYGCMDILGQRQLFAARCARGATLVGVGDAASNRTRVTGQNGQLGVYDGFGVVAATFLDSPNTTSSTTYQVSAVHVTTGNTAGVFYVNRYVGDTDVSSIPRAASFITLMEISA